MPPIPEHLRQLFKPAQPPPAQPPAKAPQPPPAATTPPKPAPRPAPPPRAVVTPQTATSLKQLPACKACEGKGRSSNNTDCVPCDGTGRQGGAVFNQMQRLRLREGRA